MKIFRLILTLLTLCLICSCGSGGNEPRGTGRSLVFKLDLSDLAAKTPTKVAAAATAVPAVITSATVTLTRNGYDPINTDLTISDNIATGRIDNLDLGYWHVTVRVFSNETEIYIGESDANVLAGVDVQVKVLFDPSPVVQTTGALTFAVGLNPMPGYKVISQQVGKTLFSETTGKVYILDPTANIIGVYNAQTMNREKDIPIASPPMSIALNYTKDTLLLGYPSGQIYTLNPQTNAMTLLGDMLTEIYCMAAVSDKVLIVVGKGSYDSVFKTVDMGTGQVLNTKSYWYRFDDIVLNRTNGVAYTTSVNVSPQDLHRIQVDPVTGAFTEIKDSTYHGDYYLGQPLRIIKNGTRVVTAGGTTFSSSSLSSQDLLYNGTINYSYADLAVDDTLGNLYLLTNGLIKKLLVINQTNFFLEKTVELLGDPKTIFQTDNNIIVLTTKDSTYYAKVFAKQDLGID